MRLVRYLVLLTMVSLCWPAAGLPNGLGGDFELIDQEGQPFHLQQLRGKVVLMFFGYTFCPDICPTELTNMAWILGRLQNRSDQVQGLFVTLDPKRDKPEVLKNYTRFFNSELLGLTGSEAQIHRVTDQYRVQYRIHQTANDSYSVDHSANLYVIDRNGRLATIVPYGLPVEHILAVVNRLLDSEHNASD